MKLRFPLKPKPPSKVKRKAGTRAGLTKEIIAKEAAIQIDAIGIDALNARNLAAGLGVSATTISTHFKTRNSLEDEIVKVTLAGTARPFKLKEGPTDYLQELLFAILKVLHGRPTLATLAVLRLRFNPLAAPLIAERILACLEALGIPADAKAHAFERVIEAILAMILSVSVRSNPVEQKSLAGKFSSAISLLPSAEFPNLSAFGAFLLQEAYADATTGPSPITATFYVKRLIHELNVK
jgi:TetR/AcrR family tetracycline transcriptional repressor